LLNKTSALESADVERGLTILPNRDAVSNDEKVLRILLRDSSDGGDAPDIHNIPDTHNMRDTHNALDIHDIHVARDVHKIFRP